jgi:sigma-B regulation protein RsbU (phosphoserine phosphatase)
LVALPTASHPSAAGLEVKPGDGTIGKAFAGAEPLTRSHTSRRPQAPVALAVPVTLDSRPIGVLSVYRPPHADLFNADDAQLLSLFANQAAVAIENARLYGLAVDKGRMDGELQAARRVQSSFIPTEPPRIPGFQLAGMWRPARQVAGDFYDYFPLRRDEWGIVMADVSDKGMPAALFMAEARSILRASAALEMDPAKVLEHANRVLTADSSSGMFVTLVFGILQARSRDFTWANGGHNLPLLWRNKEPKLQELRLPGLALGVDPDYHYKSARVSLEPQDVLVLYTDGITEAVDEQNEFLGLEPLARFIEGSAGARSAQEIVRAIDSGVNAFIGKQVLLDDATLLVIRAGGRKTGLD